MFGKMFDSFADASKEILIYELHSHIAVCLIDFRMANDYQVKHSIALDYTRCECNENMERSNESVKIVHSFISLSWASSAV